MKFIRHALFALAATTLAASYVAAPSVSMAAAKEKKCTPDGKACKSGDDCKADNCKKGK